MNRFLAFAFLALALILSCVEEPAETAPEYELSAVDFAGIDWQTVDVDSLQSAWRECCPARYEAVWPKRVDAADRPDQAPQLVQMPTPRYPLKARAMEATGMVQINILVGSDSTVWAAAIQRGSGLPLGFEEEALRVALKSEWIAASRAEKPTPAWVTYPIRFRKP